MHSKLPYARTLFEFELEIYIYIYDLGGETLTIAVAQPAAADKALKCTSWLPLKVSRHRPKAFSTHTHKQKRIAEIPHAAQIFRSTSQKFCTESAICVTFR